MNLSIHPESQRALDVLFEAKPHAVLLTGPEGIGLATIAENYTKGAKASTITVLPEKDEKVNIEKGVITVASIRRLYDLTKTIEPSGRTIIIDYAERMAPAAQNAFLKLLEEPTAGTQFILLTHQPESMLPTITSRSQRVNLRPITVPQSEELLDTLKITDSTRRSQLLFVATGLPAELTRLATDDALFSARADIIRDARAYTQGSAYQKLLLARKYKDNRTAALLLLDDAMRMLRAALGKNGDARYLRMLTRYEQLHKRLSEQGNVRLQLSATILS